jgi:predicted nucleotidyltransferase component of viral defense system
LTDQDVVNEAAEEAFKALQAKARAEHGSNTGALMVVYAVESFLRRLAISEYSEQMVLKGGMLMAANSIRQMTRDADLSTHGLANDEDNVRAVVEKICVLRPDRNDGIIIDRATIRTEAMREDAEYEGVRCKLVAYLGRAQIPFALDFSFGDPDQSTTIELESVIDQPAVELRAYPLALNLAEKIVTAMQRREVGTRDRDFADLWVTSRVYRLDSAELRGHVLAVADHRRQPIITRAEALGNMPDRQQPYAAMVARMSYLFPPPELWTDVMAGVIDFVDPLLRDQDGVLLYWDAEQLLWGERAEAS